ncbi:MAG: hypothetical protein LQ338_001948 [Usnochroma carphineum]|nr:MAG: hypothetical protein LQ338_001948 [Usnochroma carphineum]
MSNRATMLPKQRFEKDEKVLCFHGELLYDAKILEVEQESSSAPFRYRIHYKGWKSTWDDWVEADRLRKLNDENREIAQALKRQYLESTQKPTKSTASKRKGLPSDLGSARDSEERNASAPATGRGQKRGRNADLEEVRDHAFVNHDSLPSTQANPGPLAAPENHYIPTSVYTYVGTSLYSPTGSINGYLEEVCAGSKPSQTPEDPNPGPVVFRTRTPELPTPAPLTPPPTVAGAKRKAAPTHPASQERPNKRRRPAVRRDDDANDSLAAQYRSQMARQHNGPYPDSVKRQLQKEVDEIVTSSLRGVKVHPDFPRPLERLIPPLPKQPKKTASAANKISNVNRSDDKQDETFHNRPMVKIPIPDYIKSLLVDDWEEVTKNLALVPLPSPKPVNMIIDEYREEEKEKRFPGSADMDLLEEVTAGMKEYFDIALGRMLLYRFERQQYLEVRKHWADGKGEWKGKSGPGDTYGAEHLCRMIVNLPEIVAQTNMDAQAVNRLREEMTKFLQWLSKHTRDYFFADYEPAGQDYIEKTRAN